ncbi:MAG: YihY family inner membrane protein [Nitrospinae bacterium]|nr:YihY family inner membrane protein [Nitrospinota bacterium]
MNQTPPPRLYDRIVALLATDLEEKSVAARWLAWRVKLLYEIGEKFWADNCPTFAASFEVSRGMVLAFMFQRLLPNAQLAEVIERNIAGFAANAASVSVFGVVALVVFSIWVLSTVESAFNMIWKVDRPRPIINQFMAYWSAMTFAPILIAVSIIATARIHALVLSKDWAEYTYLQSFTLKMTPYLLTWVALLLVYRLIPYTNVGLRPALWGAVAAGTLFEWAKGAFNYYLTHLASYTAVYWALATIPIFLFWLYVTWLIVLFGAVIAYAIQYPKEIKSKKNEGFDRSLYLNYYAARILLEGARAYLAGQGHASPAAIQKKLEITEELFSTIVDRLRGLDLIEMLEGERGAFLFKKPLESILPAEVFTHLSGEMLRASPEPRDTDRENLDRLFGELARSLTEGPGGENLLEMARRLDGAAAG